MFINFMDRRLINKYNEGLNAAKVMGVSIHIYMYTSILKQKKSTIKNEEMAQDQGLYVENVKVHFYIKWEHAKIRRYHYYYTSFRSPCTHGALGLLFIRLVLGHVW